MKKQRNNPLILRIEFKHDAGATWDGFPGSRTFKIE
jgi:hypothetical protein